MAQDYVQKQTSIFPALNVLVVPLGNYLDRYLVKSSYYLIRIDLVTSVNVAETVISPKFKSKHTSDDRWRRPSFIAQIV